MDELRRIVKFPWSAEEVCRYDRKIGSSNLVSFELDGT